MASRNKIHREPEPMIVVGFGKHDLADFMGEDHEARLTEAFQKQWPPHYRRLSACSEEDVKLFQELTAILSKAATRQR